MSNETYYTFAPNVNLQSSFWSDEECNTIEEFCLLEVPWFRVKYFSQAHRNQCVTPCWTSFYSDMCHGGMPSVLQRHVVNKIEASLGLAAGYFNVAVMRLYASGDDNIAYHSDDRIFLDQKDMIIASATFGPAVREFSMHPVDHAWETTIKDTGNTVTWDLRRGDLFSMRNRFTQLGWLHAVKPQPECRKWRININLRRLRPGYYISGLYRFYKYCVLGDHPNVDSHLQLEYEQLPLQDVSVFGPSCIGIAALQQSGRCEDLPKQLPVAPEMPQASTTCMSSGPMRLEVEPEPKRRPKRMRQAHIDAWTIVKRIKS